MTIEIPYVPMSVAKLNKHWAIRDKERKRWQQEFQFGLSAGMHRLLRSTNVMPQKLSVEIHHARFYDQDNLVGCLKPVCDALKQNGYIVDDSPKHFQLGTVTQVKCPQKKGKTVITLEAV